VGWSERASECVIILGSRVVVMVVRNPDKKGGEKRMEGKKRAIMAEIGTCEKIYDDRSRCTIKPSHVILDRNGALSFFCTAHVMEAMNECRKEEE